jgi:hypothetical protein
MTSTTPTPTSPAAAQGPDPGILDLVGRRGITEVLHFTTNLGLVGIFGLGQVLSRARLPQARYVEHVYKPNCKTRKDPAWVDYVSLSISRINDWMFDTSERWHEVDQVWWAILSFHPGVLADPGVWFATTNNIYPAVRRGQGAPGLEALFADPVYGRYSAELCRTPDQLPSWPTDRQAEVLYPRALALDRLCQIYVRDGEHRDTIRGMITAFPGLVDVPVLRAPEAFE